MREALKNLKKKEIFRVSSRFKREFGGFLNQAVKVAGLFIYQRSHRHFQICSRRNAVFARYRWSGVYYNGPLLILTSKALRFCCGNCRQALQDYGAALVVGDERTYGKGTIQYQTVQMMMPSHILKSLSEGIIPYRANRLRLKGLMQILWFLQSIPSIILERGI